ncbi:MAG: four helix bundle protein [Pedobacter sp.]|nr:four helix bundle protein [Pedobacter sp.]
MRRSSRSANICFVEAYRKRRYRAHFISKLSDSSMENSETKGWLKFAWSCNTFQRTTILSFQIKVMKMETAKLYDVTS